MRPVTLAPVASGLMIDSVRSTGAGVLTGRRIVARLLALFLVAARSAVVRCVGRGRRRRGGSVGVRYGRLLPSAGRGLDRPLQAVGTGPGPPEGLGRARRLRIRCVVEHADPLERVGVRRIGAVQQHQELRPVRHCRGGGEEHRELLGMLVAVGAVRQKCGTALPQAGVEGLDPLGIGGADDGPQVLPQRRVQQFRDDRTNRLRASVEVNLRYAHSRLSAT